MSNIPKDPNLLFSYLNLKLRDEYDSIDELCSSLDISSEEILDRLAAAGYEYNEEINQFR